MVRLREGSVPPGAGANKPDDIDESGVDEAEDRWLLCALCGAQVTTESARTEVDGRHEHVRVNPAAESFRMGCFCHAPGAVTVGESSTFWTWFPPFAWLGAVCGSCDGHLGWQFVDGDREFHGLILDRLRVGPPRPLS